MEILRAFKLAMGCAMLPTEIDALVRSVEPTTWSGNKTFGIDLSSDFVWIDDAPLGFEIDALRSRGLLDKLIQCGSLPASQADRKRESADQNEADGPSRI